MKKLLALLLIAAMVLSMAACGPTPAPTDPTTDPTTEPTSAPTSEPTSEPTTAPTAEPTEPVDDGTLAFVTVDPITPEELGSGNVKWSEEETADGWIKVTNQGGETLGYHPDSGVTLIQVDGFAFKDLDRDGVLDGYEDWRLDAKTRALDLASQMSGEEMAPMLCHGTWHQFKTQLTEEDSDYQYVMGGGRAGLTRSAASASNYANAPAWSNGLQALCEATGNWGIPATVSVDPLSISGLIESLSLASTMDVELAEQVGIETAKQYRAVGITMLLGPQIDLLTTPILSRGNGTYGEDPALTRDIASAYINGLQSTFAADGTDLGWGNESVTAVVKHFAGAGASEGGRDDHKYGGKYTVFPGNNFEAHLIGFFDGAFDLDGLTESAGAVMPNYAMSYSEDGSLGDYFGGAYSEFKSELLHANWDGYVCTDWGIIPDNDMANWGVEDYTVPERIARLIKLGNDGLGGYKDTAAVLEGYGLVVDELGEEAAVALVREGAYQLLLHEMRVGLFENPYLDSAYALEVVWSDSSKAYALETQEQSVVMLKNDGTIKAADASAEKPTVYVPYIFTAAVKSSRGNTPASWGPATDIAVLEQYFTVITDEVGEPSGTDEEGNAAYTEADVIRADPAVVAACDYAIVSMTAPFTASVQDADGNWLPASLQYNEYTAVNARAQSIGADVVIEEFFDGYSMVSQETRQNRSYKGNTVGKDANYADLEMLQYVASVAGDDCKIIVSMTATHGMVWSEVEPLADVILVSFNAERIEAVAKIIAGQLNPNGLLPMQQPVDMDAVEAQLEDLPRDMVCYVDANGNTYDFAFGLNWDGVINDARVQTYAGAEPLTECENIDFQYAD